MAIKQFLNIFVLCFLVQSSFEDKDGSNAIRENDFYSFICDLSKKLFGQMHAKRLFLLD